MGTATAQRPGTWRGGGGGSFSGSPADGSESCKASGAAGPGRPPSSYGAEHLQQLLAAIAAGCSNSQAQAR